MNSYDFKLVSINISKIVITENLENISYFEIEKKDDFLLVIAMFLNETMMKRAVRVSELSV